MGLLGDIHEAAKVQGTKDAGYGAGLLGSEYANKDFGFDAYRRLAGEAEARLTQSRMNLTPAERAARPPWLEFDVPREQQIVHGLLGNMP